MMYTTKAEDYRRKLVEALIFTAGSTGCIV